MLIGGDLLNRWVAEEQDVSLVWFAIRSILNASANMSLLLGGPEGAKASERQLLRGYLRVTKRSAIHNRMLRHDAEHLDDRVRRAQESGEEAAGSGYGYGDSLLPRHRERFVHYYDASAGIAYFHHRQIAIPEILAEARGILALITAVLQPDEVIGLEG